MQKKTIIDSQIVKNICMGGETLTIVLNFEIP